MGVFVAGSSAQHGKRGRCNRRHVVVPVALFPNLVVGCAEFAFGILKSPFHTVALGLHPGRGLRCHRFGCVEKRCLGLRIRSYGLCRKEKRTVRPTGFNAPRPKSGHAMPAPSMDHGWYRETSGQAAGKGLCPLRPLLPQGCRPWCGNE
jgi:hypothetical protein